MITMTTIISTKITKIMTEINASIYDLKVLIKLRMVLLSTLSGVTGFIVASVQIDHHAVMNMLAFIVSLFSLAAGSAALNQYQERMRDRLMERTKSRPLPALRIRPQTALIISLILLFWGELAMLNFLGKIPAVLGLLAVILYNGMYTYLKRVTPFASVPGAWIGAIVPAIGWTAAGGSPVSPSLLGIMLFFYLWQVPHFWILARLHSQDYTNAGFPTLSDVFTSNQLNRIIFTWIMGTACASLFLPLFGMLRHPVSLVLITAAAAWITIDALYLFKFITNGEGIQEGLEISRDNLRHRFIHINIFALSVMIILIFDHGIRL